MDKKKTKILYEDGAEKMISGGWRQTHVVAGGVLLAGQYPIRDSYTYGIIKNNF